MASICVFIPVSWTGHVIIRDFYNPLLIDAQRRELGDALYIGWVTGAVLFASAVLFVCRRVPLNKGSFDIYHPANMNGYRPAMMRYHPISSVPSMRTDLGQPVLPNNSFVGRHPAPFMPIDGSVINPPVVYRPDLLQNRTNQGGVGRQRSTQSSNFVGSLSTTGNSLYLSQQTTPYHSSTYTGNPSLSYTSSYHPVPHNPVFIGYSKSVVGPQSHSGSSAGMYI